MSQEESSSTRPSRPRSRVGANRDHQPTAAQLAMLGIKVRDFAHERTLPPVRTVYRQPRQIQPSVPRQLRREDTEPLDNNIQQNQSDSRSGIARTVTEPVIENHPGPSIAREWGGFFEIDGSTDRIVNSQPFRLHPESPGYSQVIQPLFASQETGTFVPTPTVTPNGSLQWKEPPTSSDRITPPPILMTRLTRHLSGFSSPLTPLPPSPPSRQNSAVLSNRSPSLEKPRKRRKISIDNTNSRPGLGRYYLRKRPLSPTKYVSPSKRFHPNCSPASTLSRTVSVRSDHRKSGVEIDSPSSRPLHTHGISRGRPP